MTTQEAADSISPGRHVITDVLLRKTLKVSFHVCVHVWRGSLHLKHANAEPYLLFSSNGSGLFLVYPFISSSRELHQVTLMFNSNSGLLLLCWSSTLIKLLLSGPALRVMWGIKRVLCLCLCPPPWHPTVVQKSIEDQRGQHG